MDELEKILYQSKPYLLFGLAIYVFSSPEPNRLAIGFALVLLFCAGFIIRLRIKSNQRKNESGLERVIYEAQPYLYLGLGVYTLFQLSASKLAMASALLLMFCGTMIVRWRAQSRHK